MKLLFAVLFFASWAHAFPLPKAPRALNPSPFAAGYDFEGMVRLRNCSGSLSQFEGQADTDHAYVLTNGHCYEGGMPRPGTFVYKQFSTRKFEILGPDARDLGRVFATSIIYSSMTKTD